MFRRASLPGDSCWLAEVTHSDIQVGSLGPIPQRFLFIPLHYREGFSVELGTDPYRALQLRCDGAERLPPCF